MIHPGTQTDEPAPGDQQCADLLELIAQRMQHGESVDGESLLREFPQCADRLRQLLPTVQLMVDLGQSVAQSEPPSGSSHSSSEAAGGTLGDFRIVRELGRGGMGVVYEAEQLSLGRRVALKVLPLAAVWDDRQLNRFRNEARAAATLEHPHIVPVHAIGCERGVHFYAMSLVNGQTLAQVIADLRRESGVWSLESGDRRRESGERSLETERPSVEHDSVETPSRRRLSSAGAVPPDHVAADDPTLDAPDPAPHATSASDELRRCVRAAISSDQSHRSLAFFRNAARLGMEAASALDHAHASGVVHRDIKPANLMIDANGKLWITDFGLARVGTDASLTMTGDLLGTIRYMSPEQAAAKRVVVDHRTDIYSLGATLYELLSLRPVFEGVGRERLLQQIVMEEPVRLRKLNPAVPPELEIILLKAMEKDPGSRYATAQEMAADLRRFLDHVPIKARRPRLVDRFSKWCRRHQPLVAAAMLVLLFASVLLALSVLLIGRARQEAVRQRDAADQQRSAVLEREAILRRHLYAADISWAWQARKGGHVARAQELLDRWQPAPGHQDLRCFVWHHLRDLCRSVPATEFENERTVFAVAFSPDGRILASGGADRLVHLWDVATGRAIRRLEGHPDDVNYLHFSHGGQWLATAGEDGAVRIFEVPTGGLLKTLGPFELPVGLALFTPDDKTLIAAEVNWQTSESHTTRWDVTTGQQIGARAPERALALSPDGTLLAITTPDGAVWLQDLAASTRQSLSTTHRAMVIAAAFNPDGRGLAIGDKEGLLSIVEGADFQHITTFPGHRDPIRALAFSPDGRWLSSVGDDGLVRLWDAKTGGQQRTLIGRNSRLWSTSFSPDGSLLATASGNAHMGGNGVRLWPMRHIDGPISLPAQDYPVITVAFSPDGQSLITAARKLKFWSVETGELERIVDVSGKEVDYFCVAPAAQLLALGTTDGTIEVRDLAAGDKLQRSFQQPGPVSSLAFSADGHWLASNDDVDQADDGNKRMTRIWDVRRGDCRASLARPPDRTVTHALCFSADGRTLATVWTDLELRLIEISSRQTPSLDPPFQDGLRSLAYSPDGRLMATGARDRSIKLFDPPAYNERTTLLGHNDWVTALTFSPDGGLLVSGSQTGELFLWDVFTGRQLASLATLGVNIHSLAFSPDGARLAAAGARKNGSGGITIWRIRPEDQPSQPSQKKGPTMPP